MFLLIVLLIASVSSTDVEVTINCSTCVLVNNTCYNATYVLDLDAPFRNKIVISKMGVLRSENILYYSFEPKIEDVEYYKTGYVYLDAPENSGVINLGGNNPNMTLNFGTFDIDQDNSLVYLGGSNGVYVLDINTSKMSPYSSHGDTILNVFYKNNVFFVRHNDLGIVMKKGEYFKTLLEYIPVKNFVINKNDIVVFINHFGMFVGKGATVFRISTNPFFRGLTIDLDGEVYSWWIDGIYKVVVKRILQDSKIVKIADISPIGAIAFDNDNRLLFTMYKTLYRLVETKYNCSSNDL